MTDMTHYLYKVQPARLEMLTQDPTPQEAELISQHFDYLEKLTEQDVTVLVGRTLTTDEHSFGIAIFKAASEEAARDVMNNDPAVKNGVMRATLYPFRIALMTTPKH
jgi:uncharacterized protein YciI